MYIWRVSDEEKKFMPFVQKQALTHSMAKIDQRNFKKMPSHFAANKTIRISS
jgi:hypothetical protein